MEIFVDADACPVKDEARRVAARHGLRVTLVGNRLVGPHDDPRVRRIVVEATPDAADDWIAAHAGAGDIVITTDIPLAARVVANGASVLKPNGDALDAESIGLAAALRDLHTHLRETGGLAGGPPAFNARDRSRFLDRLERAVQASKRRGNLTAGSI
ncbi:MAG: YaiI/YqxD family protein [Rhodospirillaceae bacterium]|nr:YaiI/YqxD family protein [Rhodospirillaceae bacterium]